MEDCDVLIIDDDPDDVNLLVEALQSKGVEKLHYVYSAKEAFHRLEVYPKVIPKLIITDLVLPSISGIEIVLRLKAMEKYKEVYFVVLTTAKPQNLVVDLPDGQSLDIIEKPWSYEGYERVAELLTTKLEW